MTDRHNGCGGPKTPQVYEFPPTPLSIAPCSNAKPDTPYTPFNDQEGEEDFSSCLPIPVDTIEIGIYFQIFMKIQFNNIRAFLFR